MASSKTAIRAESVFLRACRGEPVPHTPIWLMRQAGRYMKEYRNLRSEVSMLELCKSPDLVSEVTVHAAETLGVDAAILFADLLLIVEPLGLELDYLKGSGPSIKPALRDPKDVDSIREVDPSSLSYVYEAVARTRTDLDSKTPLIGFAGAPFTVASYLIEGGATRNFEETKRFFYRDPGAWNALMEKIVRGTIAYVNGQIDAGADAIQIFDSWVGALSPDDYRRYAKPHTRRLIDGIHDSVPVIHFGTGTAALLNDMKEAGGSVVGLDWRVELDKSWEQLGYDVAIMGNLDPIALQGPIPEIERRADLILSQAGGRPGHIFNLGHGILPSTPVDHVRHLVDYVHEKSQVSQN